MNDLLKTQMQETGHCMVTGLTVFEIVEIISDLGMDPRCIHVVGTGTIGGAELVLTGSTR